MSLVDIGDEDSPGLRESGEVECVRGECKEVRAVVVAPVLAVEAMVRGFEGPAVDVLCEAVCVCVV